MLRINSSELSELFAFKKLFSLFVPNSGIAKIGGSKNSSELFAKHEK